MAKAKKYVYFFGAGKAEGNTKMRNLLGGKGCDLAEMTSLEIPVPAGFTITTEVCTEFYANKKRYSAGLDQQVARGMGQLEKAMGKKFGDVKDPLLVSVRSGARISMPGMMDTILNLGLNDKTVKGLIDKSNDERFAYDCYRRFVQMYGDVVLGVHRDKMEHRLAERKKQKGVKLDIELTAQDLKDLVGEFKEIVKQRNGQGVSRGSAEAAERRHRGGLRILGQSASHHVPEAEQDPVRLGDGGQRAGDGVRQHGRRERHGRGLHA